jgi:outer membrane protein assembly factor BamB
MKRSYLFVILILLAGALLSACSGQLPASSWPGVVVNGDIAYVAAGPHIYAVKLSDNSEVWRFPDKADTNRNFYATPALGPDKTLIVGSYDKILYNLNADTGAENKNGWPYVGTVNSTSTWIGGALIQNGLVYAPNSDGTLYAVTSGGGEKWRFNTAPLPAVGQPLWAAPASDGKTLYLASMDKHIYAINPENGAQIWKSEALSGSMTGAPTVGPDGVLYIGTFGREMKAVNGRDGKVIWSVPTGGWVWTGPTLQDGVLYFGDLEGFVYALNAADGKQVWKIQPETAAKRSITGAPLVLKGKVYFGTDSGKLYAADVKDGSFRAIWPNTPDQGKDFRLLTGPLAYGEDTILIAPFGVETVLMALDTNGAQKWVFVPKK